MSVRESNKHLGRARGVLTTLDLSDPAAAAVPERVGKYTVQAEIGRGALVRTFRAFDPATGRPVTLKLTTPQAGATLIGRFRDEVAAVAQLRHPNVVAIYELAEQEGCPFTAEQFFRDDLDHAIETGRLNDNLQKITAIWQVGQALDALHRTGLHHAGVAVSGIALGSDGAAIVKDFGVVRLTAEGDAERYRSPEEREGSAPDRVSDIYSLGVLCYEVLTGTRFTGKPPTLRHLVPDCPEALENLIWRALEHRRDLRYAAIEELNCDLEPVISDLKQAHVAALLAPVRKLIDAGEFSEAQQAISRLLQLDPDNPVAHRLRAELRSRQQAETVAGSIAALYAEADQAISNRQWDQALEILKSASRLRPGNAETNSRLKDLESQIARVRAATYCVSEARTSFEKQQLTAARAQLLDAIELDPAGTEAAEFLEIVVAEIIRREAEARIQEAATKARAFLREQAFAAANSVFAPLQADYPDSPVVSEWLERIQHEKSRAERLLILSQDINQARTLLSQERFADAGVLLEPLAAEFPDDNVLAGLFAHARHEEERVRIVGDAIVRCNELRDREQFDAAGAVLEQALGLYPNDALLARTRAETAEALRKAEAVARVERALEEAQWLVERDRPDLAVQVLSDRSEDAADHPELGSRLKALKAGLPEWHARRAVQDVLTSVTELEQRQEFTVALTVLEEAVVSFPGSAELQSAVVSLRGRGVEYERQKKRARRLDAVRQRIAAQAWHEALLLLESARAEFPEDPEFASKLQEVQEEIRRCECGRAVTEIRQLITDGEIEEARQAVQRAIFRLGEEPAMLKLRDEVTSLLRNEEDLKQAQIAFGKRKFDDAERLLQHLATQNWPDAARLLETVREARAISEEQEFYERGRDRAAKLIREREFEQAADLLRNLMALFPGDPILKRHLESAESVCGRQAAAVTPASGQAASGEPQSPAPPTPRPAFREHASVRPAGAGMRGRAWSVAAVLAIICTGAVVWRSTRGVARVPKPAATTTLAPVRQSLTAPQPAPVVPPAIAPEPDSPKPAHSTRSAITKDPPPQSPPPRRAFAFQPKGAAPSALPMPDSIRAASNNPVPVLPVQLPAPVAVPAPATPPPQSTAPAEVPRPAVVGGKVESATPLRTPAPKLPQVAMTRGVYGAVNLQAIVTKEGKVTRITVVNGHPLLVQAARNAVADWRYRPATLNGQPVESTVSIRIVFEERR